MVLDEFPDRLAVRLGAVQSAPTGVATYQLQQVSRCSEGVAHA
jgi:hypothetical protein